MRIIAGRLSGHNFVSPPGHRTHPMSDKIRGAVFNILGDITGLTVLDAFAGSGALSLEAASRGAGQITAIEKDRAAQRTILENIAKLGTGKHIKLIKATANAWLSTTEEAFDLVLLDPPYDDLQPNLLRRLAERAKPDGLVVLSLPPTSDFALEPPYQQVAAKAYGDASLVFYRLIS